MNTDERLDNHETRITNLEIKDSKDETIMQQLIDALNELKDEFKKYRESNTLSITGMLKANWLPIVLLLFLIAQHLGIVK